MEDWEGGGGGDRGFSLGKKHSEEGEVDYKTKAGTAWSHSYLNQKPWHPLSYPNQRRKWIAEQTHANRERRAEEVAREFSQEQEFFRQTALFSKKEKEKMEMMKAVSFMYVRPPGYNAESAKAAELADEKKNSHESNAAQDLSTAMTSHSMHEPKSGHNKAGEDKKSRPKDVFGRSLPTENEFEVLKNAPRLETGMPSRVKPFGVEIRNVRCVRCGTFGHQSGDRECLLKDAIMPNEESRLKRDDPLTAIMAQTSSAEPVKWELKQKPGMSPPRGGFQPDDPNQQIVAEEIFDEYGGFLCGGDIPALLSNFSNSKSKRHPKHKSKHERDESSDVRQNKTSKNKMHHKSYAEVDRENRRLKNYRNSSSDTEVEKDKGRGSRKKLGVHSSDSEDPRETRMGRWRRVDEIERGKNRRPAGNYEKSSDHAFIDRKKQHLRNKHDCFSESEDQIKKKRSNGKPRKKRKHSVSSDSESSDSDHKHQHKSRHPHHSRHD
ncbi:putative zinc finger CCHC domain-containing protein [Apostasia shenzhenica]|uniref:Putative zinc finger CCHC domain-containing protein n=1 Tax=Apostasia shenzhenica TaxID=1088818 RepID=A0A2I0BF14_9ASPA|nr:putative zinc finger CCHC domain-containing protein [Apostasia shenzhenica]